jgi:hypothetical protein
MCWQQTTYEALMCAGHRVVVITAMGAVVDCRSAFVECEGVELMHLLLKGKKSSRYGAIKAIDFATTRWEGWRSNA